LDLFGIFATELGFPSFPPFGGGIPFYYQSLDSLDDYLGSTLQPTQMLPEEVVKKTGMAARWLANQYPYGLDGFSPTLWRHMETIYNL